MTAKHLTFAGWIITALYIAVIWRLVGGRIGDLQTMRLNEVGDFLAGAFGPLALGWFIIGFLLQRKELQQSNEALRLQAEELRHSVEQQEQLVRVTREQLEEERSLRVQAMEPKFIIERQRDLPTPEGSKFKYEITLQNTGGAIFDVAITGPDSLIIEPIEAIAMWSRGRAIEVFIRYDNDGPIDEDIEITYKKEDGKSGKRIFVAGIYCDPDSDEGTQISVEEKPQDSPDTDKDALLRRGTDSC